MSGEKRRGRKFGPNSTPGERCAALYLVDAVGLTDREVSAIIGRSMVQIRCWRRKAGIQGKRGPMLGSPGNTERWLSSQRSA